MLYLYSKRDQADLTRSQAKALGRLIREAEVKKAPFEELVRSVEQAGQIKRGKKRASRRFRFKAADVRKIRERLGLSQSQFALLIGISVSTLQNWEQGRREPEGPARALLRVADRDPEALLAALSEPKRKAG